MSLIFDALRELETQPARAEPFAFAAAKRAAAATPRQRQRWQVAAVAVVLVSATAVVAVYARKTHESAAPLQVSAAAESAPLTTVSLTVAMSDPAPALGMEPQLAVLDSNPVPAAELPVATPESIAEPSQSLAVTESVSPPVAMVAQGPTRAASAAVADAGIRVEQASSSDAVANRVPAAMPAPSPARAVHPDVEPDRQRIVVSSVRAAAEATPRDEIAVQRGVATFNASMQRKDFTTASHELDALGAQLSPDSLTLARLRAWHALATGNDAQARDLYEQILNRVADDENAAMNLSVLDARDGRIDHARERLRRLLARNPGSAQVAGVLRSLDERGS